jgi:imidazoleglycerol-phosphate dehydratase
MAVSEAPRLAEVERKTSESTVFVSLDLDGTGKTDISTGVPFYDHMLTALGKHALFDLTVRTVGDTEIDAHHSVEDTAIVIGQAIDIALGNRSGITRFGEATVPLDEALARAVVDISGRPYFVHTGEPEQLAFHRIAGQFTGSLISHAIESLAINAGICVHLTLLAGRDPHHIAEAEFKALARALRAAVSVDPRVDGIPSTKGAL